jgi:hypothetical protein
MASRFRLERIATYKDDTYWAFLVKYATRVVHHSGPQQGKTGSHPGFLTAVSNVEDRRRNPLDCITMSD